MLDVGLDVASGRPRLTSGPPVSATLRAPWRFLTLLVFPFTYLVLDQSVGPLGVSFAVLTLINIGACALLLWRLSASLRRTLWIWLALVLFLDGYFLKMAWFAHKLNDTRYINLYFSEVRWVTRQRIIDSYAWVTVGFVAFCVVAGLTSLYADEKEPRPSMPATRLVGPTSSLVVAATLGYLFVMFIQISLSYGVLGLANPTIPFHLGSAITLFQRSVAPGILLFAVWMFDQYNYRRANATAVLIALFGLADSLITTSRGSLILLTIPVFFVWLLTGRFTRGRKIAAVALLASSVLVYPYLSSLRQGKLHPDSGSQSTTLSVDSALNAGFILVSRIGAGGVDGVWYAMDNKGSFSPSRTLSFLRPNRLTLFYTQSVVHVAAPNDFRPAGWIGGLMIVGGATGLLVMGTILLLLIGLIWRWLQQLRTWPVSLSVGAGVIAVFISGGALDLLIFVKLAIQVAACELLYRKLYRPLPSRPLGLGRPRVASRTDR